MVFTMPGVGVHIPGNDAHVQPDFFVTHCLLDRCLLWLRFVV